MKNNWPTGNKLNSVFFTTLIVLVVFGFWGDKVVPLLSNQNLLNFYPQLLATFIGAALGIPSGLFISRLTEKRKDKKILTSILTFIKTEFVSNQKNIENLQHAAETVYSLAEINESDLRALGKFTTILSQESYIAAQSSAAFASSSNDKLMNGVVNAYLNIQRIVGGVIGLEEIEPEGRKTVLIAYIKLCERAKESIRFCLVKIDEELKKFGSTITIIE